METRIEQATECRDKFSAKSLPPLAYKEFTMTDSFESPAFVFLPENDPPKRISVIPPIKRSFALISRNTGVRDASPGEADFVSRFSALHGHRRIV